MGLGHCLHSHAPGHSFFLRSEVCDIPRKTIATAGKNMNQHAWGPNINKQSEERANRQHGWSQPCAKSGGTKPTRPRWFFPRWFQYVSIPFNRYTGFHAVRTKSSRRSHLSHSMKLGFKRFKILPEEALQVRLVVLLLLPSIVNCILHANCTFSTFSIFHILGVSDTLDNLRLLRIPSRATKNLHYLVRVSVSDHYFSLCTLTLRQVSLAFSELVCLKAAKRPVALP